MSISFFAECTVLITGASAGIGREFARQLAPAVNTMILVARRNDRLEALELELKIINPHLEVYCRQLDLRDQAALERFCNWLDESGLSVDLLVNNAGRLGSPPFGDLDEARFDAVMSSNLKGPFLCSRRAVDLMRPHGRGSIVHISSVGGLRVHQPGVPYDVTKAGLDATRKLPAEGYTRGWPEEMTMADEVVALVDKRWKEYGL